MGCCAALCSTLVGSALVGLTLQGTAIQTRVAECAGARRAPAVPCRSTTGCDHCFASPSCSAWGFYGFCVYSLVSSNLLLLILLKVSHEFAPSAHKTAS